MQLPLWVDTYAHTGYQGMIRGADGVFIGRTYVGTADAVAIVTAVNERAADKAEIARLREALDRQKRENGSWRAEVAHTRILAQHLCRQIGDGVLAEARYVLGNTNIARIQEARDALFSAVGGDEAALDAAEGPTP